MVFQFDFEVELGVGAKGFRIQVSGLGLYMGAWKDWGSYFGLRIS